MAEKLGEAVLELRTDDAALNRGIKEAEGKSAALVDRFDAFGKRAMAAGGKLSLAITAPLSVLGKQAFDAAIQSREALAQVESALTSMGGASGKTVEELQRAAKQLETFSNFDDDDILQKVTANLLTFGNVSGTVFDKAQQAAVDLSARLGQDLQSSTIMLGKALNDPVKGITALQRVGVSFTEDQKEMAKAMVEAGDIAGAQALILAELEKQYGGAAKAARAAAPGGDQAQAWRTLQEVIGERLVQAFEKVEQVTAPLINSFLALSPEVQTAAVVAAALAAAIGPVLVAVGLMASGVAALIPIVTTLGTAMMFIAANPAILGLAAVLGAIFLAWMYWDEITAVLDSLGLAFTAWWQGNVQPVLDGVMAKISAVVDIFKRVFGPEIQGVITLIATLLRGDFSAAWAFASEAVRRAVGEKIRLLEGLASAGVNAVRSLFEGAKLWLVDKFNGLVELFMAPIRKIEGGFAWLYDRVVGNSWVPDLIDRLAEEAERFGIEFVNPLLAGAQDVDAAFAGITGPSLSPAAVPGVPGADEGLKLPRESMADDFRRSFSEGIQAALRGDLGGFLERSFQSIADNAFRSAIDQITGLIFSGSGSGGGLGGLLSDVFGLFVGGRATGGTIPSGSWGIVGERGPEIAIATPGGLGIMSNHDSRVLMEGAQTPGPSISMPINIDATGADPAAIERLNRKLDQLREELPERIVSTVQDASDRRIINLGAGR
ncbi:MAG: phage tail length tape measure family protein [Erythrobacter sp.]